MIFDFNTIENDRVLLKPLEIQITEEEYERYTKQHERYLEQEAEKFMQFLNEYLQKHETNHEKK